MWQVRYKILFLGGRFWRFFFFPWEDFMCLFFGILGILGIIDDVLVDLGDLWVFADLFLNTIGYLWILDGSCLLF